jgi:hypothetical protein
LLEKESRTRGAIEIWEEITGKRDPNEGRQGKKHRQSVSEKKSKRERDRKVRIDNVAAEKDKETSRMSRPPESTALIRESGEIHMGRTECARRYICTLYSSYTSRCKRI